MKFYKSLYFLLFLSLFQIQAFAQLELPKASPHAQTSQVVGLTEIKIDYHAPGVKNRKIWGNLVPYNQLWRSGANEATIVSFEDNVIVNNERVPAGEYALFTLPVNDSTWYVILNRDTTLWGTEEYNEVYDIVRSKVSPQKTPFKETLQYTFDNITENSADLVLSWENISIPIHIETNVRAKAMANMDKAIKQTESKDWLTFAQCANYLVQNDFNHERALDWVNKSLQLKETFYNNWVKAQLLALKNEYELATEFTKKAMKLGPEDESTYKTYAQEIEDSYKIWKKKRY